jgi:hypothetical protein
VASVLTYVRNSFGNSGDPVTLADVLRVKQKLEGDMPPVQQAISRAEEE